MENSFDCHRYWCTHIYFISFYSFPSSTFPPTCTFFSILFTHNSRKEKLRAECIKTKHGTETCKRSKIKTACRCPNLQFPLKNTREKSILTTCKLHITSEYPYFFLYSTWGFYRGIAFHDTHDKESKNLWGRWEFNTTFLLPIFKKDPEALKCRVKH